MRTVRTSIVVSILSLAVTAVSFANQVMIARTFGTSRDLDNFLQATSLPLLVAGAFGGLFAYAMIPALIRAASDTEHASHQTTAFFIAILMVAALVSVGGAATAPWTIRIFTAKSAPNQSEFQILAIARVAWLAAGASVVVGFAGAVLNLRSRFVLPAALSALPYLTMLAAIVAGGRATGAIALVWGLTLGNVIAAAVLIFAARTSFPILSPSRLYYGHVRAFFAEAPLALLAALTFSIYQTIDAFWAPQLGASNLSVLGYSQRMLVALGAIMATGPSVVLQPRLAASAARRDEHAFVSDLSRGLRLTVLICAPAALGISLIAHPIVRLVFERGAFTRASTIAVAGLLPWMLAGMVPMVCTVMLFKALYAKVDIRTATVLGVSGPILYFGASGLLMKAFGLMGIGIAYLTTWIVLASVGTYRVSRHGPGIFLQRRFVRDFVLVLASAALPALAFRYTFLADWQVLRTAALLVRIAGAAVLGAASYLCVALFVGKIDDVRLLARGVYTR